MKVCSVCQRCYEDTAISCYEENHEFLSEAREGSCEIIPNYRLEFLHESAPESETSATEKICPSSTLPMDAPQPLCASNGAATRTS